MTAIISTNPMVMILIIESMMIAIISKAPQNVRKYPPPTKKNKKKWTLHSCTWRKHLKPPRRKPPPETNHFQKRPAGSHRIVKAKRDFITSET